MSFQSALGLLLSLCVGSAVLAATQTATIQDHTGRGFAPDVVNYEIDPSKFDVSRLRVTTTNNVPLAVQVTPADKSVKGAKATLSFIAEVPPLGMAEYVISDEGKGSVAAAASGVKVQSEGDALVLSNGLLAIKTPKPTEKSYKKPIPAGELPALILAFRGGDGGAWLGGGKVLSQRPVKAWRVTQTAKGPVFAEVRYEIEWAQGGYYRGTVRVAQRVPVVTVTEEFDLGKISDAPDHWELNLTRGWSPDMADVAKTWGNGGVEPGRIVPLAQAKLDPIQPSGAYGDMTSQLGLFNEADAKARPDAYALVGVVPLHQGAWRRIATLDLVSPDAGKTIQVRFPMTRPAPFWVETSPFCVVTHEQELPYTYARRVWGLVLNQPAMKVKAGDANALVTPCYAARVLYGSVGLDRYKDYITQWPDAGVKYPRVYVRPESLEQVRAALGGLPNGEQLAKAFYSFGGGEEAAKRNAQTANWIDNTIRILVSVPTPSHHRVFEGASAMARAEDALSWPGLDAKQRTHLRARLATLAYLMTEADAMGSGNGAHTGNPNMSIARQLWACSLIALLPDHPMYEHWRRFYAAYAQHKLADNMAPGGGWFEFGGYHMWGYARLIEGMFGLEAMNVPNLDQIFAYHKADMDYYLNLLTPVDPRHGARVIPGLGNSAILFSENFMPAAASLARRDPALASHLMWAWRNNGMLGSYTPGAARPDITPVEPKLASRLFPGFGVIFRAHQGPDETYLALRSGYLWSHWYVDQNHVVLSSKGAVLLPSQPYAYFTSPNAEFSQYNDMRFGHPANEYHYSWPDSNVLEAALESRRVQYAWSSTGYPAWYINPGKAERFGPPLKLLPDAPGGEQKEGDFTWDRRVAFLIGKTASSPNYFVFHDTLQGEGKLAQWSNFNLLGRKAGIEAQGERLAVETEFPTKLDLFFPGQAPVGMEMIEEESGVQMLAHIQGPAIAAATQGRPVSPNWGRRDGTPIDLAKKVAPDFERHVLVRIPGKPGQDRYWLAAPRGQGEKTPQVARLSPGVVKVTHAEGVDYVLLAGGAEKFAGEEVTLEGGAGAVRLSGDEVTLALLGGSGRVGYKGHIIEGVAPLEQTLKLANLSAGVKKMEPPAAGPVGAASSALAAAKPGGDAPRTTLADGVTRVVSDRATEYLIDAPEPVRVVDGPVQIEARKAAIIIQKDSVRLVAKEPTYVKLVVGKVGVRGLGPFDLTFTSDTIVGSASGRTRTLVATRPERIIRPMYHMDGVRWYAGFADDSAPYRGRSDAQFGLALGLLDGSHRVEVREWTSPILPPVPPRRALQP